MRKLSVILAVLLLAAAAGANWPTWGRRTGWSAVDGWSSTPSAAFDPFPAAWDVSGTPMTVILDCEARGISGTDLICNTGGTWPEASTGTSPTSGQATNYAIPEASTGVLYNAGKSHQAPSTSTADITTDDFVIEVVFKSSSTTGAKVVASKGDSSDSGWGFVDHYPGNTQVGFIGGDNVSAFIATSAATITDDTWYHFVFFRDNSESSTSHCGGFFKNGSSVATTITNCRAGSTSTNALAPVIGADANFILDFNGTVALFRMYKCTGCLPGGASNATVIGTEAAAHYTLLTQ